MAGRGAGLYEGVVGRDIRGGGVALGGGEEQQPELVADGQAGGREAPAREDRVGDGGVVDDGGDAVHAGGEVGGVVAGGVLDGVGVVAARGVGVGDDDGLALADGSRKLEPEGVLWQCAPRPSDAEARDGTAVDSESEGGGKGRVGQLQVLGEL